MGRSGASMEFCEPELFALEGAVPDSSFGRFEEVVGGVSFGCALGGVDAVGVCVGADEAGADEL